MIVIVYGASKGQKWSNMGPKLVNSGLESSCIPIFFTRKQPEFEENDGKCNAVDLFTPNPILNAGYIAANSIFH